MTWFAVNLHLASDLRCPFDHDPGPQVTCWDCLWVETAPIILDPQLYLTWFCVQGNFDFDSCSVNYHVVQSFACNAIKSKGHFFWQIRHVHDRQIDYGV